MADYKENAPTSTWSVTLKGEAAEDKSIIAKLAEMHGIVKHPRWYGAREEAVLALGCKREDLELTEMT
jgi:hypothetical protein